MERVEAVCLTPVERIERLERVVGRHEKLLRVLPKLPGRALRLEVLRAQAELEGFWRVRDLAAYLGVCYSRVMERVPSRKDGRPRDMRGMRPLRMHGSSSTREHRVAFIECEDFFRERE